MSPTLDVFTEALNRRYGTASPLNDYVRRPNARIQRTTAV